MWLCLLCGFGVEADDTWFRFKSGRCLCLRCAEREIADEHPMPAPLRRSVQTAMPEETR